MYYDFTRENVQYRRQADDGAVLPDWMLVQHENDLNEIQQLLRGTGIAARIDFWAQPKRHQTHIELQTIDGCVVVNMTGSFFFDAHLGISSIDGGLGSNRNLYRIVNNMRTNRSWTGEAELIAL